MNRLVADTHCWKTCWKTINHNHISLSDKRYTHWKTSSVISTFTEFRANTAKIAEILILLRIRRKHCALNSVKARRCGTSQNCAKFPYTPQRIFITVWCGEFSTIYEIPKFFIYVSIYTRRCGVLSFPRYKVPSRAYRSPCPARGPLTSFFAR